MVATNRRPWLGFVVLVLLSGCAIDRPVSSADGGPSAAAPSPGSTVVVTTAPTPVSDGFGVLPATPPSDFEGGVTCPGTIDPGDPVAIVELSGTGQESGPLVLQDYADPSAPRTVCTFSGFGWNGLRFIDGRHLVVGSPTDANGLYLVVDVPDVRFRWIQLPITFGSQGADLVAISPVLDEFVWVDRQPAGAASDVVHVTTATGDRMVTQLRNTNAGRCGDEDDSDYGAYTRSGSLAYVMNRPAPEDASLVVLDGEKVVYSVLVPEGGWPDRGGPAMAVWSPTSDTLYYRNGPDAWRWSAEGGAERFLPGVRWFRPAISPDGTYLAYAALTADRLPDVYLVDLANSDDPLRLGTAHGNLPAFLDNDQLWYERMDDTPGCQGGTTRTPVVYNLGDGSETTSTIDRVIATWPATGSNQ